MEQEQKLKVLVYARIIDINNEMIDIVKQMAKTTRRWKYRPSKTAACTMGRIGKTACMAMSAIRLAQEKHYLRNLLVPSFPLGGIITGPLPESGKVVKIEDHGISPELIKELKNTIVIRSNPTA